jgi:hypothetical protein
MPTDVSPIEQRSNTRQTFGKLCTTCPAILLSFRAVWWEDSHGSSLISGQDSQNRQFAKHPHSLMKMEMAASTGQAIHSPTPPVWVMAMVSLVVLAIGAAIALTFGGGQLANGAP